MVDETLYKMIKKYPNYELVEALISHAIALNRVKNGEQKAKDHFEGAFAMIQMELLNRLNK